MSGYAEKMHLIAANRRAQERSSASAGGGQDFSACGPPNWDRAQWEAFKAIHGHYPFGFDGSGGMVTPPNYDNAPSWVFVLMGLREPPIRTQRA